MLFLEVMIALLLALSPQFPIEHLKDTTQTKYLKANSHSRGLKTVTNW